MDEEEEARGDNPSSRRRVGSGASRVPTTPGMYIYIYMCVCMCVCVGGCMYTTYVYYIYIYIICIYICIINREI